MHIVVKLHCTEKKLLLHSSHIQVESKVLPPNFDLARILVGAVCSNATRPPLAFWLFAIAVEEEVPRNLRLQSCLLSTMIL